MSNVFNFKKLVERKRQADPKSTEYEKPVTNTGYLF